MGKKLRRTYAALAGIGLGIAGVVANATPALADTSDCWYINGFCAISGRVYQSNYAVQVCDVRHDNMGGRVWYIDSRNVHRLIDDTNGAHNGCSVAGTGGGNPIRYFRVCILSGPTETCKAWRTVV